MKKMIIAMLLLTGSPIVATKTFAQVNISINIGSQPGWGPTGYDHADYYYLPEVNAYYDIARKQFIYLNGKKWSYARTLPAKYSKINLDNTYKVVVNRSKPYRNNQDDIRQYGQYKNQHDQPIIRNSKDSKYYQSYQHPQHAQWEKDQKGHPAPSPRNPGNNNDNHGRH